MNTCCKNGKGVFKSCFLKVVFCLTLNFSYCQSWSQLIVLLTTRGVYSVTYYQYHIWWPQVVDSKYYIVVPLWQTKPDVCFILEKIISTFLFNDIYMPTVIEFWIRIFFKSIIMKKNFYRHYLIIHIILDVWEISLFNSTHNKID